MLITTFVYSTLYCNFNELFIAQLSYKYQNIEYSSSQKRDTRLIKKCSSAPREKRDQKKKKKKNIRLRIEKQQWKREADLREKARKGNRSAQGEAKSMVMLQRARTSMQPLSSILFQFPVQGDYGVSRGAASRLALAYTRESVPSRVSGRSRACVQR